MQDTTYTPDGETEYETVYDIPEDAEDDHTVYIKPADEDDGARSETVTLEEFRTEFEEATETDMGAEYMEERARNGWGIQ